MTLELRKVMKKTWLSLILVLNLIVLFQPVFAHEYSGQKEQITEDKDKKNVLNINAGAAVVLGIAFKRFHIPINYERVVKPDMSIVIGNHPAVPFNSSSSGVAYGASVRIRNYRSKKAPQGLWTEWGIWGIYQHEKLLEENRSKLQNTFEDSMAGVLFDFGYKFMGKSSLIIEPFIGIALPIVVLSKERTKFLSTPFPWAGLSIGFAF
jgi:hypothetical protein